jgi:DNA-binding transcriptional regulator YiaG
MTEPSQGTRAATAVVERMTLRRRLPAPHMRRALRVSAGLSAAEVADALGVTRQAISRWERGEREPRGPLLTEYVAVLDAIAAQERGAA